MDSPSRRIRGGEDCPMGWVTLGGQPPRVTQPCPGGGLILLVRWRGDGIVGGSGMFRSQGRRGVPVWLDRAAW